MNDKNLEKRRGMLYPMLVIASVSVIIFSALGIATLTGVMPNALSQKHELSSSSPSTASDPQAYPPPPTGHTAAAATQPAERRPPAPRAYPSQPVARVAADCASCGVVESIQTQEVKGQGSGLGIIAGGVVGGILGNQVGAGHGRDLATVAGAVGGGFAGNEIEKNARKQVNYVVRVRMQDGSVRAITQSSQPGVVVGERVRIQHGALARA